MCLKQRRGVGGNKQRPPGVRSPVVVDMFSASSSAARSDEGDSGIASMESARSRKRKREMNRQRPASDTASATERKSRREDARRADLGCERSPRRTEKNKNNVDTRGNTNRTVSGKRHGSKSVGSISSRDDSRSRNSKKSETPSNERWMEDAIELSSSDDDNSAFGKGAKMHSAVSKASRNKSPEDCAATLSKTRSDGNQSRAASGNKSKSKPVGGSTSAKSHQQTNIFGKIVKGIQEKDLSTCSKSARAYNNDAEEKQEPDAGACSTSAQRVIHDHVPRPKTPIARLPVPARADSTFSSERLKSLLAKADKSMKETFRIPALRNLQPQAVRGALSGQSQIIVMATGGGKSLCYQLPATVLPGVTVVVAPLIALMVDQVSSLNARGIPAALVSSANSERENTEVLQRLVGRRKKVGKKRGTQSTDDSAPLKPLKLVYCTPELIATSRFRAVLSELHQRGDLALFAIDEAHCLSTWGHDFRPAYRKLNWVRSNFDVPLIACTATATEQVIQDIRDNLNLADAPCHMSTFNRANISYQVRYKANIDASNPRGAIGDLTEVVKQQHIDARRRGEKCSGIIYVHKRDDTQMLAQRITREAGVKAAPYHGGLKDAERADVQRKWTEGQVDVAVATVAFGMGIDLPHVRYVLHWSMAKTVEGFYQESGRGGRDGLPALSILYYSKEDASKFAFIIKKSMERKQNSKGAVNDERSLTALQGMVDFCTQPGCRRSYLLRHFGETIEPKKVCKATCDHCKDPVKVENSINLSGVSRDVMKMTARQKSSARSAQEWDGQWSHPHGDEGHERDEDHGGWEKDDGGLRINHSGGGDLAINTNQASCSGGFVKARSVLDKFEVMEMEQGRTGGFVNFKAKEEMARKQTEVRVPEHLRQNLPDPLQAMAKKPEGKEKNTDNSSSVDQLKAELEQLRAKKAARLAEIQKRKASSSSGSPKFAAPPSLSLSFSSKKSKKKRR